MFCRRLSYAFLTVSGFFTFSYIVGCAPKTSKVLIKKERQVADFSKKVYFDSVSISKDTFQLENHLATEQTLTPMWYLWSAVKQFPTVKEFTIAWDMSAGSSAAQYQLIYQRPKGILVYTSHWTTAGIIEERSKAVYKNVTSTAFDKVLDLGWESALNSLEKAGCKRVQHFRWQKSIRPKGK